MIKRATILKYLKHHGKYERRHFTMKKNQLEEECKTLGIDLTQNIDNQPVGEAVKVTKQKQVVVIQEPDSSSDDETSDDEQVTQTPTPSPVPAVVKKLSRKNQKVEKLEKVKVEPDNKGKVTELIKDLNRVIKELFSEFDKNSIDDVDEEYIRNEFNMILSEGQDILDSLVANFTDNEISKVETKIDLMYTKLDRFLS